MKRFATAAVLAACFAAPAIAAPYCDALTSRDTVPKKHVKRAPFLSDTHSGWILGADQLKNEFEVSGEVRLLWRAITDAFAERGVELVVLAAPPRPLFVPADDMAAMGHDLAALQDTVGASFSAYIAALNDAGIKAPDLSDMAAGPERAEFYFQRDTHWTPRGAALSVARLRAEFGGAADVAHPIFDASFEERGSLSDVIGVICGTQPAPEVVPAPRYDATGGAEALFAEARAGGKIALVGTSFSNRYKRDAYRVGDAVAHYFDAEVANYSLAGGGPTGAIVGFIESGALDAGEYAQVIWESPYTVPLVRADSLRQVLGALQASQAEDAVDAPSAQVSDTWTNVPFGFDADAFAGLSVHIPGTTAGRLMVELIAEDGKKQQMRLIKSDRVPAEHRTDTWTLALAGLSRPQIERIKLRLMGVDTEQTATLRLLR